MSRYDREARQACQRDDAKEERRSRMYGIERTPYAPDPRPTDVIKNIPWGSFVDPWDSIVIPPQDLIGLKKHNVRNAIYKAAIERGWHAHQV